MTNQTKYAAIAAAILILMAAFFSLGTAYEKQKPCNHDKPYEVQDSTGGVMLIVPGGWYAIPLLNKHGRPWKKPTDQEG